MIWKKQNRTLTPLVFVAASLMPEASHALDKTPPRCPVQLLKKLEAQDSRMPEGISKWLSWETTPSIEAFKPEFKSSSIPLSLIPREAVEIIQSVHLPEEVGSRFLQAESILWPKHPYNTVETTPFFKAPELSPPLKGEHTASRSMVIRLEGKTYGLKMPTDHPFGPNRAKQMNKAFPKDSMRSSLRRTEIIDRLDEKLGRDPDLILLKDILSVSEKKSGIGYTVRDLTPLDDGHYYFPAHMIPVLGPEIAAKSGGTVASMFKEAWAKPLGELQAKLLVRYGMEFNPINPQNFLIQLNRDFKPTGRIACRDLGDAFQVKSVSRAIGLEAELATDQALGLKIFESPAPSTKAETLTWGFNLSAENLILPVTRDAWMSAHDDAFVAELQSLTGIQVPKGYGAYAIDRILEKAENQSLLARFHKK